MSAVTKLVPLREETVKTLVRVLTAYTWEAYGIDEPTPREQETIEYIRDAISQLRRRVLLNIDLRGAAPLADVVVRSMNLPEAEKAWRRYNEAEERCAENDALLSLVWGAMEPRDDDPMITGGACSIDLIGKPGYRGDEYVIASRPEVKS